MGCVAHTFNELIRYSNTGKWLLFGGFPNQLQVNGWKIINR